MFRAKKCDATVDRDGMCFLAADFDRLTAVKLPTASELTDDIAIPFV